MAAQAHWGICLARTDPEAPQHKGITYFLVDMHSAGIEIRPLREMTGEAVFNEIFLDGALCEADSVIGGVGNGWAVTQTTLHFERMGIGAGGVHVGFPSPGPKGGMLGRRAGDAAQESAPVNNMVLSPQDVIDLARKTGRAGDPLVRQAVARLWSFAETGRWTAARGRADAARGGGGSAASIGKVAQTRIVKQAAHTAAHVLGPDALLGAPDGPEDGRYTDALVFSPASSIYGGTDEIQRNIIAERSLGLPRDVAPDRGVPYGEVLRRRAQPD
jgi:alkylation response protein AidB-like acyl-CoA dehydrogenase